MKGETCTALCTMKLYVKFNLSYKDLTDFHTYATVVKPVINDVSSSFKMFHADLDC